eukprot:SAG11_NODE_7926_length_1080_cov_1.670744_1_plen_303_part_10
MAITDAQLDEFAARGCVTIDSPFTPSELRAAAASLDEMTVHDPDQGFEEEGPDGRMRPTGNHRSHPSVRGGLARAENFVPALLGLLQHPWQEQVAQRVLRSADVVLLNAGAVYSYPEPEPPEAYTFHIDEQTTREEMAASPFRGTASLWLWLTDVGPDCGPLMVHPGSHHILADAWAREPWCWPRGTACQAWRLTPGLYDQLAPAVPVLARAGQVTLMNYATLHSASYVKSRTHVRKMFLTQFVRPRPSVTSPLLAWCKNGFTFLCWQGDRGCSGEPGAAAAQRDAGLRLRMRPERRRLIRAA